jgi:putative spermidine/putrescine transport system substrate-binding protein
MIADHPIELPLKPEQMVVAFRKWDELVGSRRAAR